MATTKVEAAPPIPSEFSETRTIEFWGAEYSVTPAVADTHHGDGQILLRFQPLATRPDYYLIRVDSRFDDEPGNISEDDDITDVIDLLCDEFGEIERERESLEDDLREQGIEPDGDNTDLAGNEDRLGFPVLHLDCGYWWCVEAVWDGERWVDE